MEFGDYEEDLPTAILGGADESWNADDKRDLHCISRREWLAGFRPRHDKNWSMFKWVSVTFNVQTLRREGRLVEICRLRSAHFIGLQSTSDRTEPEEDSPVYTTRADKFRVYRFPVEARIFVFIQALGSSDCQKRENTFLPANVRRIHTPPAPLGRTRRGTEAGPGRRGPHRTYERNKSVRRFGSGRVGFWTKHRHASCQSFLLDANGHISQTIWPEQTGKYSSKKTTLNGQCLGELLRDHHLSL